jgi:hypothetical protein
MARCLYRRYDNEAATQDARRRDVFVKEFLGLRQANARRLIWPYLM